MTFQPASKFGHMLAECRRIAKPPREFSWFAQRQLAIKQPPWMEWNDPLRVIYEQQNRLLREGEIVWAHLVQANKLLFSPGPHDHPAAALFSTDPYFDERPAELGQIAHRMFAAKGKQVQDPQLQQFGDELADEMKRTFALPVPPPLAGGRRTVYTGIMVVRKHLPQAYLAQGVFPLLIRPEVTEASMILPSRFWPPELVGYWGG